MTEQTFVVAADQTKAVTIPGPGKYTIELAGPGAHADIGGHFLLKDKDDYNVEIYVVHKAPHTTAQTTLKGVAFDRSKLRFFGRIVIEPGCPNVQSFLEERILLLSDDAKAEAVPELEILSDDVKCSHAASVSRVPEEHLFYLQSRGLTPQAAEDLIVQGFLQDADESND
jgi:Fe-S cluster assembly protein SufD